MTIETIALRNDYIGNGSQTVFAFTFKVLFEVAESPSYSIEVVTTDLLGIETIKTQITDYAVTLNTDGTGIVTFATAPITGHKITLLRSMSKTQRADYVNAGTDKFPGNVHELALDKLTLILQEYLEKFNRVITIPKNSLLSNIEFPIDVTRADQVLVINSAGDNLTTKNLADVGLAPVTNFIKTLLDDIDAAAARGTLSAQAQSSKLDILAALASVDNLSALAGLTGAANKVPYFTNAGAMALTDAPIQATILATGLSLLPQQVTIKNNVTDSANDIDFSSGNFKFSDGSGQVVFGGKTKRLDAAWVFGNANGGLDAGTVAANTSYHCYLICNPASNLVDAIFSTNASTPTLPSGYTKFKRVGSIRTNASTQIRQFIQNGNKFHFKTPVLDIATTLGTTGTLYTLSSPTGLITEAFLNCFITGGGGEDVYISNPAVDDLAPSKTAAPLAGNLVNSGGGSNGPFGVITNTSSQIRARSTGASTIFRLSLLGWTDINLI